jgi:hypothetical protein
MLERMEDTVAAGVEALGLDRPGGRRLAETHDFFSFLRRELADAVRRWPAERDRLAAARPASTGDAD